MIDLARKRQKNDLKALVKAGYTFDEAVAARVRSFFETFLHHYKGEWAGSPVYLEDWQFEDILAPVFGWYRPDGTRRFREAYIEVPRKNGKTFIAAGVGLYMMIGDGEPAAEVYSAATKKDQAKLVWADAAQMVKMSADLSSVVTVRRSNMHILDSASKFEPLGADSNTLDGLNPNGVIIDELHAHKDRRVYDVLTTAYGARRNPLTWIITTAGLFDPESIGWQKHEYAQRVLRGEVEDDSFFAYVACADPEDDPMDPATWEKANPNYGVSVKPRYLEEQAKKARQQPSFYNSFLRYHLNVWTQTVERWLDSDKWAACDGEIDLDELEGRECWGGLDMSSTLDLTAFVLCFPPEDQDEGEWIVVPFFWCPEDRAEERDRRDSTTYAKWGRQGYITMTPGNEVGYQYVLADIVKLGERFALQEVWYDPWNSTDFTQRLTEQHGIPTVQCRQGFASLNEPSKKFEALVYTERLRHGNNPVLRWMASHVTVKTDPAGNIKPDKKASREKIDGIVATIMAIGAASTGETGLIGIYDDADPIEVSF